MINFRQTEKQGETEDRAWWKLPTITFRASR